MVISKNIDWLAIEAWEWVSAACHNLFGSLCNKLFFFKIKEAMANHPL